MHEQNINIKNELCLKEQSLYRLVIETNLRKRRTK